VVDIYTGNAQVPQRTRENYDPGTPHAEEMSDQMQRNEIDASSPRDLARRLLAYEALTATTSEQTASATVRIYEKLRQQLCAPIGVDGFRVLASRALRLSKAESPELSAVQLTPEGTLRCFDEVEGQSDEDQNGDVGVILIAQLLGLFLIFLGEATTLRLIEGIDLQFEVRPESNATDSPTADPVENLLREAERLRSGSERLQALANQHHNIEDRLISIAWEIRKLALVLDVFALSSSTSEGPQQGASRRSLKGYVM
jgi:hypothetical protein